MSYDRRLTQVMNDIHYERRGYRPGRRETDYNSQLPVVTQDAGEGDRTIALPGAPGECLNAADIDKLRNTLCAQLTPADMARLCDAIAAQVIHEGLEKPDEDSE